MIVVLIVAGIVAALAYYLQWFYSYQKLLPPGPKPLPFVGNILSMEQSGRALSQMIHAMGKEHGGVFTFWLPQPMVFVTDWALAKQYSAKEEFATRPYSYIAVTMNDGPYGILNLNGENWKEQRRFTMQILHNFGFGKNIMQDKILAEVFKLVDYIKSKCDSNGQVTMDPNDAVTTCIGCIVGQMVFSQTYEYEEERFATLRKVMDRQLDLMNGVGILLEMLPFLRHLPIPGKHEFETCGTPVNDFYKSEIAKAKKELEAMGESAFDQEPANITHAYLIEMHKRRREGRDMGFFSDAQLVGVVADLWAAGLDTTTATINWAVLYAGLNPHAQQKLHDELDEVLGEQTVSMSDKTRLPYTMAFITETQRTANIISMNAARLASADISIGGHHIPKGTPVSFEFASAMQDEDVFPDPEKFDPDRFVVGDAEQIKYRTERVVPFSAGKRVCIGESLARQELFLLLTSMFQHFTVTFPESQPSPTLTPVDKLAMCPTPYKAVFTKRH